MVKNQVVRDVKQLKEAWEGLDFIMELFEVPRFPRTIATGATAKGQRLVNSRDEAMTYFEAALYEDCYINAYPAYDAMIASKGQKGPGLKAVPNHIIIDLDRSCFESDAAFEAGLAATLQNIKANFTGNIAEHPVIVMSGNGNHVHVPLPGWTTPLEDMPQFAAFKDDKDLPNKFLRWAERTLSNGMADRYHNPSIKSALFRVPGTINTKARAAGKDSRVRIVEGIRYAIVEIADKMSNPHIIYEQKTSKPTDKFLNDFLGFLIQGLIDNKVEKLQRRRYGLIRVGSSSNNNNSSLAWIEQLLKTGVEDSRKNLIFWVLAPYLITVKNIEYDTAYHIIEGWLERCEQVKGLEPGWDSFRYRIRYCLDLAEEQERRPIRFETFKEYYPNAYRVCFSK